MFAALPTDVHAGASLPFGVGSSTGVHFGAPPLAEKTGSLRGSSVESHTVGRGIRLGAALLDSLLMSVTLGVGWVIWAAVICNRGQTPAKQIVDLYVVDSFTKQIVPWWKIWVRLLLPSLPFGVLVPIGFVASYSTGGALAVLFGVIANVLFWGVPLVDAAWVLGPTRQRLTDVLMRTTVVRGSAYLSA